jgi:hypothetical protein
LTGAGRAGKLISVTSPAKSGELKLINKSKSQETLRFNLPFPLFPGHENGSELHPN